MTSLRYIHHDCFILDSRDCTVVFDYWKMPGTSGTTIPALIDTEKPVYVLVSHFHKDHFNPEIFGWAREIPHIRYIISADTARHARKYFSKTSSYSGKLRTDKSLVTILTPGEEYSDCNIRVNAFGSTDTGNSYLVTFPDGRNAFHAGDLNAWVWRDESTPQEIDEALSAFRKELEPIKRAAPDIDVAMFPVDARIGTGYYEGASIFVREFNVGIFVPMHFCLGETPLQDTRFIEAAADFSLYRNPERGEYIALTGYLSSFEFPESASREQEAQSPLAT